MTDTRGRQGGPSCWSRQTVPTSLLCRPCLAAVRRSLSAVCRARYASPPVRVERERPCEVKAVQVEGRGVGARSSERQRRALTSHGRLPVPAWRQRSTFFPPVTTIAPGMKQAERCYLARTFRRINVSNYKKVAFFAHLRYTCSCERKSYRSTL